MCFSDNRNSQTKGESLVFFLIFDIKVVEKLYAEAIDLLEQISL